MTGHVCKYCQKTFVREESLSVHVCEQRRRYQEKDDRGVQLGLHSYFKFYELTQGSAKLKTFDDFVKSSYYKAFVKFGKHCVDIHAIKPERFIEWLLKHNKKIDHWCKDSIYTEYLSYHLQHEAVEDALTRAIEFGTKWNEETGHPAHDCLRFGNSNSLSYQVSTGRISAWILYNCESGQKFLSELNEEQVSLIWPYIDSAVWQKKFKDYPANQEFAVEILKKAGW